MSDTGKDKITVRISKEIINQVDEFISSSDKFKTRSDFIRHLIKKEGMKATMFRSSHMTLHQKTFEEILKFLSIDNVEEITKKNSFLVHSSIQKRTKIPLQKIKRNDAFELIKKIYESCGLVKEIHFERKETDITVCMSGDNLENALFSKFVMFEMVNIMSPWFKLKSFSETPGNLLMIFE